LQQAAKGRKIKTVVPSDPEMYNMTPAARKSLLETLRTELERPESPPPEIKALQSRPQVVHREPEREPEASRPSRPITAVVLERETSHIQGKTVRSFEPRNLSKSAEEEMEGIEDLLSAANPTAGLAKLQAFVTRKVAFEGVEGFAKELDNGYRVFDIKKCVEMVGETLNERPGNLPGLISLGLIGFCGSSEMEDFVMDTRAIPTTIDVWLGHVYASRLFFEYAAWARKRLRGENVGDFVPSFNVASTEDKKKKVF
jgi:hypothetical protein